MVREWKKSRDKVRREERVTEWERKEGEESAGFILITSHWGTGQLWLLLLLHHVSDCTLLHRRHTPIIITHCFSKSVYLSLCSCFLILVLPWPWSKVSRRNFLPVLIVFDCFKTLPNFLSCLKQAVDWLLCNGLGRTFCRNLRTWPHAQY